MNIKKLVPYLVLALLSVSVLTGCGSSTIDVGLNTYSITLPKALLAPVRLLLMSIMMRRI